MDYMYIWAKYLIWVTLASVNVAQMGLISGYILYISELKLYFLEVVNM